jgi:hypothetical protein
LGRHSDTVARHDTALKAIVPDRVGPLRVVLFQASDVPVLDDPVGRLYGWNRMPVFEYISASDSYTSVAPGRPDCSTTSCRWVRERPYSVFPSVATPSDRDVRGSLDDDTSVSGSYYLP